jgi:hypothetical protein
VSARAALKIVECNPSVLASRAVIATHALKECSDRRVLVTINANTHHAYEISEHRLDARKCDVTHRAH